MRTGRLHYAWVVAGLTFLTLVFAAGVRAAPGVLMVPLEQQFGWSRAVISFGVAVNIFLYGMIGPFSAALMERFGMRRVMLAALLLMLSALALATQMSQAWHFILLWGLAVGLGSGVIAVVLGATVASRWFSSHRGLVVGALTAATATGQLIFLPIFASLVEAHGWRSIVLPIGAVGSVVFVLVAIFMRDRPYDMGLSPFGDRSPPRPPVRPERNPLVHALSLLHEGLTRREFWLLSGSFFICGLSTNGLIGTHLIPACVDSGIPEVVGASLLASMGVFDLAGTTMSGYLSDRFDGRKLLAWYYGLRGISLVFLPFALNGGFWSLGLFAAFYGLDWVATVPPTVRLAAKCFGEASAPIYFGWILAMHQVGAAIAAWGAGLVRVEFGQYLPAFLGAGAMCFAATAMVLTIDTSAGGREIPARRQPIPSRIRV